jgi:hypothetical protein
VPPFCFGADDFPAVKRLIAKFMAGRFKAIKD